MKNLSNHLCECGCGGYTTIAPYSIKRRGLKKGEPHRFIHGHNKPWLGLKRSKEDKEKFSVSHIGLKYPSRKSPKVDAWNKGTHESGMKGKNHSEESKRKIKESNLGKRHSWSEEGRARFSKASNKWWSNKENREQHIKKILSRSIPNKKELWLEEYLNELYPNEWKFVGNGQVIIAGKCPDFININGQKENNRILGRPLASRRKSTR